MGEIRKGIEAVADAQQRRRLNDWLEADLPAFFNGCIMGIDEAVADRRGRMTAAAGRPLLAIDNLLAATPARHGLVMVTRNLLDLSSLPVQLLDARVAAPT